MSSEMTPQEKFERILSQLSPEDAEMLRNDRKALLGELRANAHIAIVMQNLSHGVGKHALSKD